MFGLHIFENAHRMVELRRVESREILLACRGCLRNCRTRLYEQVLRALYVGLQLPSVPKLSFSLHNGNRHSVY